MAEETFTQINAPRLRGFGERVERAIRLTERLNSLPYGDQNAIQAAWAELTGQRIDETFHLIPPVYSDHGINIRLGRNVFINQGCRLNDVGGIEIGDDVMLGPSVSLITSGHRSVIASLGDHRRAHPDRAQRLDRRLGDDPARGDGRRRLRHRRRGDRHS
jgi:acetyltransferase-like isoleucine patch superfamily enzyme